MCQVLTPPDSRATLSSRAGAQQVGQPRNNDIDLVNVPAQVHMELDLRLADDGDQVLELESAEA